MTTQFTLLTLPAGEEITGDSRSAIVDQIIPGYGTLPETPAAIETRLELREAILASLAQRAQATTMAALTEQHPDAIAALDDDALTAIYHDRQTVVPELTEWASDIPLYLLASGYAPYTTTARPTGATIVFLDSGNETTFLEGLQAAGFGELYVRADEVDEA